MTITTLAEYQQDWDTAQRDPDGFWLGVANERITWATPPTKGLEGSFATIADAPLKWFADGALNASVQCLDRHLDKRGDQAAILWEGDEPGDIRRITYRELHREVCRLANALASLGVAQGDRVILYMGMVPEAAIAMLALARLGAVHSVVFGGFSASAIAGRVRDCGAKLIITQDAGLRGGKKIPLKATIDEACKETAVDKVVVLRRTGDPVALQEGRDLWWHDVVAAGADTHAPAIVPAEHPLFILYTSGSTGQPKGVLHTTGGYMAYAAYTHATSFGLREGDIYACVADVGWITGHSYIVYGPLANGTTTVMFESVPTYPDAGRYWDMVERHRITIFYGAPTALRVLANAGDDFVKKYDRSSLRVLGTVGEPINPTTWNWYHDVVGNKHCSVIDTWWQTETGGHAINPIAGVTPTKPGSANKPLPGIVPALRDSNNTVIEGPGEGRLFLEQPWPGQARTVWNDHERFVKTYFAEVPGVYFTGDGCRRDQDGDYWITGRVDDVVNVSGHRMGTAEFESAITSAAGVTEAAVVGYPHDAKGQGIYAFVVAAPSVDHAALDAACRKMIGAHARIDKLQIVPGLPKTRSGKVMRRILRKIAEAGGNDPGDLGDLTTLADPGVVEQIKQGAAKAS